MWRRRGWRGRGKRWRAPPPIPVLERVYDILALTQSEPRRSIIEALSTGEKSTNELYQHLESKGYRMPRTTLYYHLSELEAAGVIEHAGYKETGGGAPEKIWVLRTRKICIDLVTLNIESY